MKPDKTIEQVQTIDYIISGEPLPLELFGRAFTLRQPSPNEYDMVRAIEAAAYHSELERLRDAGLDVFAVSDDMAMFRRLQIEATKAQIEREDDPDELRELEDRLSNIERPDTRNRAEELASNHGRRVRDRWIFEHCLLDGDGRPLRLEDRAEIMRYPAAFEAARQDIWRIVEIMVTAPKW